MRYAGRWIAVGLLLAAPILDAQNPASPSPATPNPAAQPAALTATPNTTPNATTARPHHKSRKAQKEVVLPPLPAGPLSQVPMDQIPASPAKVSYQDGLLTIVAQNSTLGEILRDVRKLTGAAIEIPQGAGASERVVVHLGPGAPRDVLAGLLNGSSFNYVMLGTSTDPTALASVMLLAKTSASGPAETQTAAANPPSPPLPTPAQGMPPGRLPPSAFNRPGVPQPGNAQAGTTESDDSKDDDQDAADDNADDQAQPQPGQPDATAQEQPQPQQPGQTPTDPNQPNAGPRTPEQIMQMLRNQQQPGTVMAPPPPQQPPQQ